jgi:hypothetical protein
MHLHFTALSRNHRDFNQKGLLYIWDLTPKVRKEYVPNIIGTYLKNKMLGIQISNLFGVNNFNQKSNSD